MWIGYNNRLETLNTGGWPTASPRLQFQENLNQTFNFTYHKKSGLEHKYRIRHAQDDQLTGHHWMWHALKEGELLDIKVQSTFVLQCKLIFSVFLFRQGCQGTWQRTLHHMLHDLLRWSCCSHFKRLFWVCWFFLLIDFFCWLKIRKKTRTGTS